MSNRLSDRENFAAFMMRMRAKGVVNSDLCAAFEAIPRRGFVPSIHANMAYCARSIPIECGEVIESLDLQAHMINELGIEPQDRVLEVGTGTGFTAAVMSKLALRVTTSDRYRSLCEAASSRFVALNLHNVSVRHADAKAGLSGEGAFDRIIVWASFDAMPRLFVDQLATNGIMICAIGPDEGEQALVRLTKIGSRFDRDDIGLVRFQPLATTIAAVL
jgi:protein-L-isoaspartate(D-aspartate) O-methyltransferase